MAQSRSWVPCNTTGEIPSLQNTPFFAASLSSSVCRFLCTWATNRSPLTCRQQNRGWDIFHCRWESQENRSTEETSKHVFENAHRRYGEWFYERVSKQSNLLFLSELQNGWKECHPTPEEGLPLVGYPASCLQSIDFWTQSGKKHFLSKPAAVWRDVWRVHTDLITHAEILDG